MAAPCHCQNVDSERCVHNCPPPRVCRCADIDSTFQGFAGADFQLQDALQAATEVTRSEREVRCSIARPVQCARVGVAGQRPGPGPDIVLPPIPSYPGPTQLQTNGNKFYEYIIDSPEMTYLSSITTQNGKIFALFVKCPTRYYAGEAESLKSIVSSFETI